MAVGEPPPPSPPQEEAENNFLFTSFLCPSPNSHRDGTPIVFGSFKTGIYSSKPRGGLPSSIRSKPSFAEIVKGTKPLCSDIVKGQASFKNGTDSKGLCRGKVTVKPTTTYLGKPAVIFSNSDKLSMIQSMKYVLIGKFTHGRPALISVKEYFANLKLKGLCNISIYDSKHLILECEEFDDYVTIWMAKTRNVAGFWMRLFKWREDFNPSFESPVCPVWVHLPGLPLFLYQEEVLLSLANAIGRPLALDSDNINRSKLGCASLCVEVDVSVEVLDKIWIEFEVKGSGSGRQGLWQKVVFDRMPDYCTACSHLGHSIKHCLRMERRVEGEVDLCATGKSTTGEFSSSLDVITGVPRSDSTLREVPAVLRSVAGESVGGMLELKLVSAGLQEVAAGEGYDNELLVEDLTLEEGEFVEGATALESSSPVMDDAAAGEFSTAGNDPPRVLELTKVNAGSEELASAQLTAGVLNATEMETEEAQVQEASSEGGLAGEYATEELALMRDFPGVLADKGSDGCRELTAGVSDASSEHSAGLSAEREHATGGTAAVSVSSSSKYDATQLVEGALNAATRTSATAADGSALHIGAESVLQAAAAGLAEAASDLARQPATPGTFKRLTDSVLVEEESGAAAEESAGAVGEISAAVGKESAGEGNLLVQVEAIKGMRQLEGMISLVHTENSETVSECVEVEPDVFVVSQEVGAVVHMEGDAGVTPRRLSSAAAEFTPKCASVLVEIGAGRSTGQTDVIYTNNAMEQLKERLHRLRGDSFPAAPSLAASTWVPPSMSKHLARELKKIRKQHRINQNWQDIQDVSDEESEKGELEEKAGSLLSDEMGDIPRPFKIKSAPNSPKGRNSSYDSSTYLLSRGLF